MVIETYLSKQVVQTVNGPKLVHCVKDPNGYVWVSALDLGIDKECAPLGPTEKAGESGFPDLHAMMTPPPKKQP
jgi:hypothetical protein